MNTILLVAIIGGVALLLVLILYVKLHPFLSLLITTIFVGACSGMPIEEVFNNMKDGIGGTLGFVATIVGLGAIFGAILERSGGAKSLASWFAHKVGENNAPWSMMIAGFFVSIPVFFDVAFIILLPVALALKKATNRPLLQLAIPLLAGLAITHSFIPPTPGPVAVANILEANLGWVIVFGFIVGVPAAVIAGPLFAKIISKSVVSNIPDNPEESQQATLKVSPVWVLMIILLPIVLMVLKTIVQYFDHSMLPEVIVLGVELVGHPFSALIIANLVVWYFLGIKEGVSRDDLLETSGKSFYPAGAIILLTGAGGAFKQILVSTGAGGMLAEIIGSTYFSPVVFSFIIAAIVRVVQGSATVAMITAAGITAPILAAGEVNELQKAILVISIASGATFLSHVNDSGFWLVSQYLNLGTRDTFKTWTMMTVIIGLVGQMVSVLLWYLVI